MHREIHYTLIYEFIRYEKEVCINLYPVPGLYIQNNVPVLSVAICGI